MPATGFFSWWPSGMHCWHLTALHLTANTPKGPSHPSSCHKDAAPKCLERGRLSAQCPWAGEVSVAHLSQDVGCSMGSVCVAVSNGDNPASNAQGFVSSLSPNGAVASLKV